MSEEKVIKMGRGGTPYIRIPIGIDPDNATVVSKRLNDAIVASATKNVEEENRLLARIAKLEARREVMMKLADHLRQTEPRPMTPDGLVHVSGTITMTQWAAVCRAQNAALADTAEKSKL